MARRSGTWHLLKYDVYVGRRGHKTEADVLAELLDCDAFQLMPGEGQPTVKITDYFFADANGDPCDFEDLEKNKGPIFLHGTLMTWGEEFRSYTIGNVKVSFWLVFSPLNCILKVAN
jgi:hypothetical protein